MLKERKSSFIPYLLFLVWPFFALIYSTLNYNSKHFKNIVCLFSGFLGSTFYLSQQKNDAHYYGELLTRYHQIKDVSFIDFVLTLFTTNSPFEDQFYPILNYVISRFTDDFYILYTILGLLYGYLLSRNLDFIIKRANSTLSKNIVLFLICFFLLAPIWNIYNVRFWITAQYFFFFAIRYLYQKNIKLLLMALLSMLMHFSFILPCSLLVLYYLGGNRYWLYMIFFLTSIVLLKVEIEDILSLLPKDIGYADSKVLAYTADEYVKTSIINADNRIFIVKIRTQLLIILNTGLVIFLFFLTRKRLIQNEFTKSLFSYSILFFAISSALAVIPTMNRFVVVSTMFLMTLYICVFQEYNINKFAKGFSLLYVVPILLYCIVEIRVGLDFITTDTIILNPLVSWVFNHDIPLIKLIK